MNNNNYNFIEQSFINNLKLIAREVVREELQANGYAVRPDSQFMPNYDPGNTMQDIMSKAATMPDDTSVNDVCVNYHQGKKYKDLKEFGLFDLMPNGFDLYLDDDYIAQDEDSLKAQLVYDIDSERYILSSNSNIIITNDELLECIVTYISSSIADFSVPALWIKPSEEWYKKFEYSKLTAALSNVAKKKVTDTMNKIYGESEETAKPKRRYTRRKNTK